MTDSAAKLTERWSIVDGLPLFARVSTEAAPAGALPLVHVHGFGISGRYLVPTAELLAPHYPTYVPDLPGYGRSHKPKRTLTIPELADALVAFMDAVGVAKANFLGNSMGCLIIIELAHKYPERIDRAILVSPAGGPHNQPIYRGVPQLALDGLRETPRMLPVAVPDYIRFGPISSLRLFHAMVHYPTIERALALDLPILAVVGVRDPLVSKENDGGVPAPTPERDAGLPQPGGARDQLQPSEGAGPRRSRLAEGAADRRRGRRERRRRRGRPAGGDDPSTPERSRMAAPFASASTRPAEIDPAWRRWGPVPRRAAVGHRPRGLLASAAPPGIPSPTTTPAPAPTAGARTACSASPTTSSGSASPSPSGTAPTRSSRSASSG